MTQRITPQLRQTTSIPSHFDGEEPSPLLQRPIVKFRQFDPLEIAPSYANSPRQVTLPGKDKAKVIGIQNLGNNKRAAVDPTEQQALEAKKHLSIHFNDLIELANNYFKRRDYQDALKFYEALSSKNDPIHLQMILYRKSKCCWMLGYLKEAKECLNNLLQIDPDYAQAWARRGAILIQQHKYPEALADLKYGFALSKAPRSFVKYTLLFDYYDSFTNATDETAFHLQHVSYDFLGNPLVSEDDLCLLRGIFFASRENYTSAIEELSIAAQKPSNHLALQTLKVLQNISKRRGHTAKQHPNSVTLQTGCVPLSVLLNQD